MGTESDKHGITGLLLTGCVNRKDVAIAVACMGESSRE
jgi:hypothetical protein